ncbi:diguanylate cyclase [Neisseriaceae bacterium JH1-16]|nr:diguanylate cyclase [Neisseriaceae bacterium JH1-16]
MPTMVKLLLTVFLCLVAAIGQAGTTLSLPAQGGQLSPNGHVEVLRDPSGRLKLAEVRQPDRAARFRAIQAADRDLNFGYSASAYWLRFTVDAAPAAAGRWLLEVGFPALNHVDVYLPAEGRHWAMGSKLPFATGHPIPHRNFVVPLDMRPQTPQTVYLRVASEGSLTVPLELWRPDAFAAHNQDSYFLLALYYGMLLALALYNLLLYLSLRDRNHLIYVAFAASMAVGQLSLNGFGNQFLWPHWPNWGSAVFSSGFAATGLFGALFTRNFLATRVNAPRLDRLILLLAGSFAIAALGPLALPYRWCAILTSLSGASFALVAVITGVVSLRRRQAGARYFLLAWTLLLLGVGMMALRNLAWLPTNALTANGMQIGSALEMLLLSFALADRIQTARREKDTAQAEALASKEAMLDVLRQSEQQLERRVGERTRELAKINARLLASENKLSHMAHHDPLTGLANRLLLHQRLGSALLRAQQDGQRLAVLVIDLDGFKPVNDSYGHEAGDRLLIAVARALSEAVRTGDTVARLGGDEFVIVLDPQPEPGALAAMAERLIEAVRQANAALSPPTRVGASIGVAIYPEHGDCLQSLLRHADQAMYDAKRDGRGRWRLPQTA